MKKSFKINIPEPCHEDWASMSPSQKGKFCQACEKEVVDFSRKTDEQLYKLVQSGTNLCGRFMASQLNRDIHLARKEKNSLVSYATSLLLPISVLVSQDITAQGEPKMQVEQTDSTYTSLGISSLNRKIETTKTTFQIKGVVYDDLDIPLIGVNILIKGTQRGAQTDFDGNFTLEVNAGDILEISYIGYDTKEIIVGTAVQDYKIILNGFVSGGITLGMYIVPDPDPNPLLTSITNPHDTDFEETSEQKVRIKERREHWKKAKAWEKVKEEREKAARKAARKKKRRF